MIQFHGEDDSFFATCAAIERGSARNVGNTSTSGTLLVEATVTITTPLGDQSFDLPMQTVNIPAIVRPLDPGQQPV